MNTKPKSYFLTFADERFRKQQERLNASAQAYAGFSEIVPWNKTKLMDTEFYNKNKTVFDNPRGCGYWLWKPYIIFEQLKNIEPDDYVVYWDCGRKRMAHEFDRNITPLLLWCTKYYNGVFPGITIPWHGPNKKWTKKDCFVYMECDSKKFQNHPQIQASFSIWQKNVMSITFVEKWLMYCQDQRIITDEENCCGLTNDDRFIAHRHDQSVLTNLVIKEGLPTLNYPLNVNRRISKNLNELNCIIQTPVFLVYLKQIRHKFIAILKKLSSFFIYVR